MKTVLLVEDDSFLADIYTAKLKQIGYEVEIAADGDECLRKLKKKIPDLLLLDIVLPGIDGWEILRKIKEKEELSKMKIIILSNLGQKQEVEKGLQLGAIKYLIKSYYTPGQVVGEIKKVLEKN